MSLSGVKTVDPALLERSVLVALAEMLGDKIVEPGAAIPSDIVAKIGELSAKDAFDHWLRYHGIIGYTHQIIGVIGNIQDASR